MAFEALYDSQNSALVHLYQPRFNVKKLKTDLISTR